MPKIPIVFGGGLDRETGLMAMEPGGMDDLRNVHLLRGKYQVRRGFERVLEFTDPDDNEQTDILGGIAVLGQRAAVYVTYDSVNGIVNVWQGDAEASWVQWVGEWEFKNELDIDFLAAGSAAPVISLAEYNGTVMLAHTSSVVASRAQTCVVTKNAVSLQWELELLHVTWGTEQNVRFRGVAKYLEYMIGWGWGEDTEDRPELVRVSLPAQPTEFDSLDYWIPGDQGDPVIACYPAGESLICFKESQTWELFGDSFLNFGQRPLDTLYGMTQPNLAVSVEGAVFAWTTEGPRIYSGRGTSTALELPLELTLPEPYDLVDKGDENYAFAVYMPVYRSIWFVFGQRVYSLYIREDNQWRWGYQELGFTATCGFRLPMAGWGMVEPPTGYPTSPTISAITDTTATLTVTNNDQDGDETLEIWARPGGSTTFSLLASFPVETGGTQAHDLTGFAGGWYNQIAVRYRRGPYYTAGYEADTPISWPSTAQTNFTTTMASIPTIDTLVWSRVSATVEKITIGFTPPYYGTGYDIEVRRGGVYTGKDEDIALAASYDDTACTGEANNVYDCRLVSPYVDGAYTATSSLWGGPVAPTLSSADPEDSEVYGLAWLEAVSADLEVYDSLPAELEGNVMDTLRDTVAWDESPWTSDAITGSTGKTPWVAIRHKVTAFTVTDYSDIDSAALSGPIT